MNNNDLEDNSSLYILGKEFIIVIVVIFSGLSFTLGYFVGKMSSEQNAPALHQKAEIPPLTQKIEPQPVPADAQQAAQPAALSPQSQVSTVPSVLPETQSRTEQKASAPSNAAAMKTREREIIYTVQLAAFRSSSDADNAKANLEKKGYKAYITISRNSKNETIYKVRTGEFKDRKDADIFSLKLKKNEGLNTFVTFKNE